MTPLCVYAIQKAEIATARVSHNKILTNNNKKIPNLIWFIKISYIPEFQESNLFKKLGKIVYDVNLSVPELLRV